MYTKVYNLNSSIEPGRVKPWKKGSLSWLPDAIAFVIGLSILIYSII